MSKKKEKEQNNLEPPIDYQVELKNLQYTIVLKDNEITSLKEQNDKRGNIIKKLENDYNALKKVCANNYELEKEIGKLRHNGELLQKEIEKLNQDILIQKRKYLEEKEQMEKLYNSRINQLQTTIDSYTQKIETANKIMEENKQLNDLIEELKKEKLEIIKKNERDLVDLEVRNKLKFANLKKKMIENIKNTKDKVTEINMQYMDVSSKLTLLQNHQLLMQIEYLSQQVEELSRSNEILQKKNFELQKDIEIHKEVEISLADKNKKLKDELLKEKNNNNSNNTKEDLTDNNINVNSNTEDKIIEKNEGNDGKKYNINLKMINLEQKIINLEKKLTQKKKDFNYLKEKYEYIENVLKNYENKFLGIFNFLEDCLNKFFIDDELTSNQEVNIHIDDMKKGDFSSLNKEEQYSTLIILMKYLMPLIDQTHLNNNIENINKVNIKFHFPSVKTNINGGIKKFKKIYIRKPVINFRSVSAKYVNSINSTNIASLPSLPVKSIETLNTKKNGRNNSGYKQIYKVLSSRSRISNTSAGNN